MKDTVEVSKEEYQRTCRGWEEYRKRAEEGEAERDRLAGERQRLMEKLATWERLANSNAMQAVEAEAENVRLAARVEELEAEVKAPFFLAR
jgi:hypothetical protein